MIITRKEKTLEKFFAKNGEAVLGFSGGVDSSYLLYAGKKFGAKIKAFYVKTDFQPEFEFKDAQKMAELIGTEITVIEKNIFDNSDVISNPADRCYYCKKEIFGTICAEALAAGIPLVIDGTNASDDSADRPGMKALAELTIRSPLKECGLTKPEVRALSKKAGLFTWDKPAYACLATRIPTGQPITLEILRRVENAEDVLFAFGFSDFRVRVMGEAARLQFPQNQLKKVLTMRTEIIKKIMPYFSAVLLDLETRGGNE